MKLRKYVYIFLVIIIITLSGCGRKLGYVDKSKKRSEEEVKQYTINHLRELYNIDAEIINVEARQINECSGYIDGSCYGKKYVSNGYTYTMNLKANNVEFIVTYTDAYTNTKENSYHDVEFTDNYMKIYNNKSFNTGVINKINSILSKYNVKGYVYNDSDVETRQNYAVLMSIKDLSKLDKIYNESTSYVYSVGKNMDSFIHINFILSNEEVFIPIKANEGSSGNLYSLKDLYNLYSLYFKTGNTLAINTSVYNQYAVNINKKYYNYVIKVSYSLNNNKVEVENNIYGLEKK